MDMTDTKYPYKLREDRSDPRRDDYYILTCGYCEQPTKHKHLKDRLIPFYDIDNPTHGKAIDHIYKCSDCGSVRRWGLSSTRKVTDKELKALENDAVEV